MLVLSVGVSMFFGGKAISQVPSYVPANGLVGWWPFNGNANDESGNGNNGTVNGATLTMDRFGNANKAFYMDNGADLICTTSSFSTPNSLTYSVWIKSVNSGFVMGYNNGQCVHGGQWDRTIIIDDNSKFRFYTFTGAQNFNTATNNVINNVWNNIVVTMDFNGSKIYLNGNLISINLSQTAGENYTGWFRIGGLIPNLNNSMIGNYDDIGVWNRALTQQEISDLYLSNSCSNNLTISPTLNTQNISGNTTFTAATSDLSPSFNWQSDFGQGFQTLSNYGNYSGANTNTLTISNVQLSNHNLPIRAISTSGNCVDTSNVAILNVSNTCTSNIAIYDTITTNVYDTLTTNVTVYDTITTNVYDTTYITINDTLFTNVTDTLIINTTLSLPSPNNANTIKIYPNPASDHITIDNGNFAAMSGYSIKIVNNAGQQVFQNIINQAQYYVDLSTWSGNGLYFVHLIDPQNNTVTVRKIVLQ